MWVRSLGQEDPLEEGMTIHSSILAQRIPWTEETGRQFQGHKESDTTDTTEATQHVHSGWSVLEYTITPTQDSSGCFCNTTVASAICPGSLPSFKKEKKKNTLFKHKHFLSMLNPCLFKREYSHLI